MTDAARYFALLALAVRETDDPRVAVAAARLAAATPAGEDGWDRLPPSSEPGLAQAPPAPLPADAAFGYIKIEGGVGWAGPKPPGDPAGWVPLPEGPKKGQRWKRVSYQTKAGKARPVVQGVRPKPDMVAADVQKLLDAGEALTEEHVTALAMTLQMMTVADIQDVKRRLKLKASGNKEVLARKVAERALQQARAQGPQGVQQGQQQPPQQAPEQAQAAAPAQPPQQPATPPKAQADHAGVLAEVKIEQSSGRWPAGPVEVVPFNPGDALDLRGVTLENAGQFLESEGDLTPLVEHLKNGGTVPPPVVALKSNGHYDILDGEHRLMAAGLAGVQLPVAVIKEQANKPVQQSPGQASVAPPAQEQPAAPEATAAPVQPQESPQEVKLREIKAMQEAEEAFLSGDPAKVAALGDVAAHEFVQAALGDKHGPAVRKAVEAGVDRHREHLNDPKKKHALVAQEMAKLRQPEPAPTPEPVQEKPPQEQKQKAQPEAPKLAESITRHVAEQFQADRHQPIDLRTLYEKAKADDPGLSVADFHKELRRMHQAGEIGLEPVTRPTASGGLRNSEYALPTEEKNKHGEPWEVYGYATPKGKPETAPEEKPVAEPKKLDSDLKKWWDYGKKFQDSKDGLVPMHRLLDWLRRDHTGLTEQEFHKELDRLWGERKLSLHVLNESGKLTPEQRAAGLEKDGKHYGYVQFKADA